MVTSPMPKFLLASLLVITLLGSVIGMSHFMKSLPTTGFAPAPALKGVDTLPVIGNFIHALKNGQRKTVVGVYIPGVFAVPVDQQPKGDAGFVTRKADQVTQFGLAAQYGTVGILAHNDLAGAKFSNIRLNQYAVIVYGDGHEEYYVIREVQKYQALTPTSTFSDFVNLNGSSERLSAGQLFTRIYGPGNRLVFQTCIEANGDASWGRMFIIAEPAVSQTLSMLQQTSFMLEFSSFGLATH